jgi:hypothetical protein
MFVLWWCYMVLARLLLSSCDRKVYAYLTTGHTTTTGMFPVLANTSVTGGDMATVLASVAQPVTVLAAVTPSKRRGDTHLVGIVADCVG